MNFDDDFLTSNMCQFCYESNINCLTCPYHNNNDLFSSNIIISEEFDEETFEPLYE